MDFNYLKKRVAVLSAVALATAGMTATVMPAAAAPGDASLGPASGSGNTAFATDPFELEAEFAAQLDTGQMAFRIDNPDQKTLAINPGTDVVIFGIKADGEEIDTDDLTFSGTEVGAANPIVVDFDALDIVSVVIHSANPSNNKEAISVQLDSSTPSGGTAETAVSPLNHGDLTSATSVTVTAWLETANAPDKDDYSSVDSEYSASYEVNFVDPSDVSAIPGVQRFDGYRAAGADQSYSVVGAVAATDTTVAGDTDLFNVGDSIDGVTLAAGDIILYTGTTGSERGIYRIESATDTSPTELDTDVLGLVDVTGGTNDAGVYSGDGVQALHFVEAYVATDFDSGTDLDSGATGVDPEGLILVDDDANAKDGIYSVADTDDTAPAAEDTTSLNYPIYINSGSSEGQVFFGDGSNGVVQTATALQALNQKDDDFIGGSLKFSNSNINLAQVNLANWQYQLSGDTNGVTGYAGAEILQTAIPAGFVSTDGNGQLNFGVPGLDTDLDQSQSYQLSVRHIGATDVVYNSGGFEVIKAPSSSKTSDTLDISVGTTTDAVIGTTYSSGYPVDVRSGVDSLTFTAQLDSDDGTTAREANIPVLAVVTAGANWTTGETLTVSGSTETIASATGTIITTGLTNSDGQFAVTVTSSDASSASAKYDIQFFVLSSENDAWESDEEDGNAALFKVDYASATLAAQPDGFGTATDVASGSSVTLTFDVEDQFGEPLSADATGKAYSVELQASDDDDLDLDAPVVDGSATFTFDNYVTAGGSDVLTAKLYTGSATSPTFVSGRTDNVTLYNTNAIAGINLTNDEFTGENVEYTDFFAGKAAAGQKEPATDNNYTVQGTVVDANGAGVPGAPVTISAEGMAFKADGSTTYAVDSIDVIASAAGAFKVDFWTQTYSEDGVELTVTSGDQTATATVEAALADGDLDPGNLRLSWTIDEDSQFVMNTTYAVTATLEDVFGNPVEGAALKFTGLAAAEFNGVTAETRVTGEDGTAVAYLRSIKDVSGLSAVGLELVDNDTVDSQEYTPLVSATIKDDTKTSWDESAFENSLSQEITFLNSAADVVSTDQKVNAGSFKGYVAVYAKGYEGQRLSAKIGNDWVIVDPIVNNDGPNLARVTDFTGAGVDIQVRIYIDRVLMDTIPLTTK